MTRKTYQEARDSFEFAVWDVIGSHKFDGLTTEDKADVLLSIEEELNQFQEEN